MKKYVFAIDNQDFNVEILSIENGNAQVSVNNEVINVQIKAGQTTAMPVVSATPVNVAPPVTVAPPATEATPVAPAKTDAPAATTNGKVVSTLRAPLPGILIGLKVNVGDRVKINDEVLVLEAMKMENNITSECDGVVLAIKSHIGEAVLQGDVLIEFGE